MEILLLSEVREMQANYIQVPYTSQPITYHKGKVKRVRHAKRKDVPEFYRKDRFIVRLIKLIRKGF